MVLVAGILVDAGVGGGADVVAAGSGSGEDCRFFCVYASDGQFAVDASWVDATGTKAGVACESDSLTSDPAHEHDAPSRGPRHPARRRSAPRW